MGSKKCQTIQKSRKLVIVGNPMSGRRTLLLAFEHKKFVDSCCRTIFETSVVPIQIHEKTVNMALFDTCGQEDFDRLRSLVYPDTNIVLICFSVDNPLSATSVIQKWAPEIRRYCDRCPIILVACKTDLRNDPKTLAKLEKLGEKPVTSKIGQQIAAQIKADAYMECSSKTGEGVEELFIQAARFSIRKPSHHSVTCQCILQ